MKLSYTTAFCVITLAGTISLAQKPDYTLHGAPVSQAPADPAIARAILAIQPASIQKTIQTLVSFGTRNTLSSMETDLPPGQGINAAADWIASQFEAISKDCNGCLEVHRDDFIADPASGAGWGARIPRPTKLTNIYAIQRGTDPVQAKRMYLVSGHFDSINSNLLDTHGAAPGANDDASGMAAMLECARALSKLRFPATLVFVAVPGEEQGLVGSAHVAHMAREQGWRLEAVLNNDIIGGNTTPGDTLQMKDRVRVFSEGVPASANPEQVKRILARGNESDSPSRELARTVADTARTYFPVTGAEQFSAFLVFRLDRYLRGGDHSSFNDQGFAAVRFTEWREDYTHEHKNVAIPEAGSSAPVIGDLPQFVDFKYVARVARLNAATLATLADSPGQPQKVAFDLQKLENATTLHWNAPEGAGADVRYELLWRETTAPDWQFAVTTAPDAPTAITVPVSKDNVIFGVRTVDAAGHRGLVVVP